MGTPKIIIINKYIFILRYEVIKVILLFYFSWISFDEFQAFEVLLSTPEALYNVAFQLFDTNGSGKISYGEQNFCLTDFVY